MKSANPNQLSEENSPMVKALFNLRVNATPNELYQILYNIDIRKAWDKASVLEFQELDKPAGDVVKYYMLNKAPWPFTNRDFIETRYTRIKESGDIEIFYKEAEGDFVIENNEKIERGNTIFGGQIFRLADVPSGKTLLVTLISHCEMRGKIPPKALKETLPLSLLNWYRSVRKELLKNHVEIIEELSG